MTHTPLVADVKRNCLDDGPGIRTTVFFKGCPLRCVFCHNPECIDARPELLFRRERCIGARDCLRACTPRAIRPERGPAAIDRASCDLCAQCVAECPAGALEVVGKAWPLDELLRLLLRDEQLYRASGGGVTLSGGEATLFAPYAGELACRLHARGLHVLLETCGHFVWEAFRDRMLPHLDTIYFDLKVVDAQAHARFCGRDNATILDNLGRLLAERGERDVLVRIPLVPGVTATADNLAAAAALLRAHGLGRVALLPYNPLWTTKAEGLGRAPAYEHDGWLGRDELRAARAAFEGFEVVGEGGAGG